MDRKYEELLEALNHLGIERGDVVLLKGDLSEVGLIAKTAKASRDLVFKALWQAVGGEENGTLVTSGFTNPFFRWNLTDFIFNENSPSKGGGAITKYFLEHPHVTRSKHPTNSFVALGKHSKDILSGHDEKSRPYDPVGKVIEFNGKALSLGAVAHPPDFMTGHYAQQQAGYTRGSILSFLSAIKYIKNGQTEIFRVEEVGGCSRGHYIVYAEYVRQKKLKNSYFGNAYSISMLAKEAFELSYNLQAQNPRSFLCDDPNCFSCRGSWLWNIQDWPSYYFRNSLKLLRKLFSKN
jgi:aminoglycoside 3-N-acetyltransferase